MLEYACIYLNKHSSKYARILIVSDVVHSIKSLHKLLSSFRDRHHKKRSFPLRISSVNVTKYAVFCGLVIFTEEVLNGKLHFCVQWKTYSEHCQTFKIERFAKRIMSKCRGATIIFQDREGFVELGPFDKYFVKNRKKRPYRGTFWGFFS